MIKRFIAPLFLAMALNPQSVEAEQHINITTQNVSASADFNVASSPSAPDYTPEIWTDSPDMASDLYEHIEALNHSPEILDAFYNGHIPLFPNNGAFYLGTKTNEELAKDFDISENQIETYRQKFLKIYDRVDYKTNCYAYAVNDHEGHYAGGKPNPGEYSGLNASYRENVDYGKQVLKGAISDGLAPAGDTLPDVKDGYYRVALYVVDNDESTDYHWLREDQGGGWSSKLGHQQVTNRDYSDNVITDPATADFGDYKLTQYFYVPEGGIDLQSIHKISRRNNLMRPF